MPLTHVITGLTILAALLYIICVILICSQVWKSSYLASLITTESSESIHKHIAVVESEIKALNSKVVALHEKVEPPIPDPVNIRAYQTCYGGIMDLRNMLQTKHPDIDDSEFVEILNRAVYDLVNGTRLNE